MGLISEGYSKITALAVNEVKKNHPLITKTLPKKLEKELVDILEASGAFTLYTLVVEAMQPNSNGRTITAWRERAGKVLEQMGIEVGGKRGR